MLLPVIRSILGYIKLDLPDSVQCRYCFLRVGVTQEMVLQIARTERQKCSSFSILIPSVILEKVQDRKLQSSK